MTHFGIISPPVSGHINPLCALGRELIASGHRVTYFQMLDLEEKVRSEGMEFWPIGQADHPRGSLRQSLTQLGRLQGRAALRFTLRAVQRTTVMVCRDGPTAIRDAGVEALLVDQMEPAGGTVAEHLGRPFVTICNALPINRDAAIPPPFTAWKYSLEPWARLRNRIGYLASAGTTRAIRRVVAQYRAKWHLPPLRHADDSFSERAQICQMPSELDYPRRNLPKTFHYVGPLRRPRPVPDHFPWERLDGRLLVYASLGTLQGSREPLFRCFAEACRDLNVQLVISHGGGLSSEQAGALPGRPLVVPYAPQCEVLARAGLAICHAGLNTVLDALANGVPLVMTPITYEQPAIARRVEWIGAGRSLCLRRLTVGRLRRAIQDALSQPEYVEAARRMREACIRAGGAGYAAEIVKASLEDR
jgi:MGT family glycosyltransferase